MRLGASGAFRRGSKTVAKPELGNKRQCQHCATKFFDLNKSPVVCPKCGATFVAAPTRAPARPAPADDEELETDTGAELVSLEDADSEDKAAESVEDVEIEDEGADDDAFLEEEEEDDEDVSDLIDGDLKDDEEG